MTEVTEQPKEFRFQNQRALLTYATHLNKEEYIRVISKATKTKPTFIRLAHETGDETTPYEHTHVLVDFGRVFQTRNQRFFDFPEFCRDAVPIHPHIKTLKHKKAFEDAKRYIAKEDPDNADLSERENMVTLIQSCDSLNDAFNETIGKKKLSVGSAMAVKTIYENRGHHNLLDRYDYKPRHPWQIDFLEEMKLPATYRTIIWYYNESGNMDKTATAKHLLITEPDKWYACQDMGTAKDAGTIIANAIAGGWNGWGIIINLTLTCEHHSRMYTYIEQIKDGLITSQKYSGRTFVFHNPHVVVMANFLPQREYLIADRWDIRTIREGVVVRREFTESSQLRPQVRPQPEEPESVTVSEPSIPITPLSGPSGPSITPRDTKGPSPDSPRDLRTSEPSENPRDTNIKALPYPARRPFTPPPPLPLKEIGIINSFLPPKEKRLTPIEKAKAIRNSKNTD